MLFRSGRSGFWHFWKVDYGTIVGWSAEDYLEKVTNQPPNKPNNIGPSDGATDVSLTPNLRASAFSDPDPGDTHWKTWWDVRRCDNNALIWDSDWRTFDLTSTTVPSGKLDYSTCYKWRVRHMDNPGLWSEPLPVATTFTTISVNQPPILSNDDVTPSSGDTSTTFNYYVTYEDADDDAPTTKYVYIDGYAQPMTKVSGSYSSGATFKYSTTLSTGSHNYYFYFNDGNGHTVRLPLSGTSSGPSVSPTATVPSQPRNLRVTDVGDGYVYLAWDSPSSDGGSPVTNYKIYRGTYSGGKSYLATVGNQLSYNDNAVTNGQIYYYKVSAVNSVGEGVKSDEVSVTVPTIDTVLPTISISSPSNGQTFTTPTVTVSGTASDNVYVSKVEVSVGSGSWQTASGTTSWSIQVTLNSGSNTIYARVTDTSGNTKETSVTVNYNPPIQNNPPSQPTALSQLKSDGVTSINVGGTTTETTVIFKGNVNDPDGNNVKLQIELRRLDEYGGSFTGTHTQESDWISSGSLVSLPVYGLVDGNYHWQARTVDSSDLTSSWVSFGSNSDSTTDFTVSATPQTGTPSLLIEEITPNSGAPGTEVTINGRNLKGVLLEPRVFFGLWRQAEKLSNTDTQIKVRVPQGNGITDVWVDTDPGVPSSNKVQFVYEKPVITDIIPLSGVPGEKVTIKGKFFGSRQPIVDVYTSVSFGASELTPISWTDTEIVVKAPSDYGTGLNDVKKLTQITSLLVGGFWGELAAVLAKLIIPEVALAPGDTGIEVEVTVKTSAGQGNGLFFYVPAHTPEPLSIEPSEDVFLITKVIYTEAGSDYITDEERTAVGWTILNRLRSGEYGNDVQEVAEGKIGNKGGFGFGKGPQSLAGEESWLAGQVPAEKNAWMRAKDLTQKLWNEKDNTDNDPTRGATYFFSPRSMPWEGEKDKYIERLKKHFRDFDTEGGLHEVPGTSKKVYFPGWAKPKEGSVRDFYPTVENLQWISGLGNIRNDYFMFYRPISTLTSIIVASNFHVIYNENSPDKDAASKIITEKVPAEAKQTKIKRSEGTRLNSSHIPLSRMPSSA